MVGLHKTKGVGPRVRIPSTQLKEFKIFWGGDRVVECRPKVSILESELQRPAGLS